MKTCSEKFTMFVTQYTAKIFMPCLYKVSVTYNNVSDDITIIMLNVIINI